jgi:Arc/MetJ family transcription regulator
MKMTMHIDDELLDRVMKAYGCESKTEAVEMALKEMDRRARLKEFMKTGLGFKPGELAAAVDPAYDVLAMRVAEPAGEYGKRRTRR